MKIGVEVIVFGTIAAIVVGLSAFSFTSPQSEFTSSLPNLGKAPDFVGTQEWINSEPLAIEQLKDKVVVVDFWTYSCINCIRTLPYLNEWHEKYADKELVIIGVHTPEFEFEKDINNVKAAVEKYKIKHPVVQDNNYATWKAYNNRYWPRKYVIDKKGNIRYDHIGEGAYEETENVIAELLGESGVKIENNFTLEAEKTDFSKIGTPELYMGYEFARTPLGNSEGFLPGNVVEYKEVAPSQENTVYLSGSWRNEADRMVAINNSKLYLIYSAKDANLVAGGNSRIEVTVDGIADSTGRDAKNGSVIEINGHLLYNIVSGGTYGTHLLEIKAKPGFEIYTFTFG